MRKQLHPPYPRPSENPLPYCESLSLVDRLFRFIRHCPDKVGSVFNIDLFNYNIRTFHTDFVRISDKCFNLESSIRKLL